MPSNKFWGAAFGVLGGMLATPAVLVKAATNALNGESFDKGLDKICDAGEERGREFGEEHGKTIEKAAVTAGTYAVLAVGAKAVGADKLITGSNKKSDPKT